MKYIVRPGDTLYLIARRFGLTLNQLLGANPQITNPNIIFVGQRINIPIVFLTYIVEPGDTLYLIAQRFGLTLRQLLAANPQIPDPNIIFVDQPINIPRLVATSAIWPYTVQPGDTLFHIARRFGTSVKAILQFNPSITNPDLIFPGQRILIPLGVVKLPDGCIVYIKDREIWRSDTLGRNKVQLTKKNAPVTAPRWSFDGKLIAYLDSAKGLIVINSCGEEVMQLADEIDFYAWSNDGTRIAYSNEDGTFIVNLQGHKQKVTSNLFNPVWFPGDQRLAGYTLVEDIRFPILASVDITGENFKTYFEPIVPAFEIKISPDGRYALTQLRQGFPFGMFSGVWVYNFATNQLVQLPGFKVEVIPFYTLDLSFIGGWAPDSSRLVYTTLVEENGLGEIRIATPGGRIQQALVVGFDPQVIWGPFNEWIIYSVAKEPYVNAPRDIYILNTQTRQEIKVTKEGQNFSPDWSHIPCPDCG
ncbi:hypothetical protein BBF96_09755 [Anoxybacter fermentans]|uniref:LysM domain-containing protein n=1 Tax=Anoxybacter fermentans TaxID=1323375 RepID=A0A3Q9HQR3_9FIRM|nr:LysM peptidoglycan-binding domain-containing protein [Anoxybacter fermentans]AZR73645.1 hypothetical protein BBF96_09755 [Anoxybacter fermentans]